MLAFFFQIPEVFVESILRMLLLTTTYFKLQFHTLYQYNIKQFITYRISSKTFFFIIVAYFIKLAIINITFILVP